MSSEMPALWCRVFIGQSGGKKSVGMKQSEQKKVLADFKAGKFNTLVATCIAEEGLDIAQVTPGIGQGCGYLGKKSCSGLPRKAFCHSLACCSRLHGQACSPLTSIPPQLKLHPWIMWPLQVDMVVCFDTEATPLRNIQRMGRTGRHKQGRVVYILSAGREQEKYRKGQQASANGRQGVSSHAGRAGRP